MTPSIKIIPDYPTMYAASGITYHDFEFNPVVLGVTGYRTGNDFGQVVSSTVQQGGDPTQYVVLVNDNYDQNLTSGLPDDTATTVPSTYGADSLDTDVYGHTIDPDFGRIVLNIPDGLTSGTVTLSSSDPSAIKFFADGTGAEMNNLTADLSHPSANLNDLAFENNSATVWFEGLKSNPDEVVTLTYTDTSGNVIATDSIHMDIVDFTFVGTDGTPMTSATPLWKDALVAAASDPSGPWQDRIDTGSPSSDSFFRAYFQGLSSSADAQLQVSSDSDTTDNYSEQLVSAPNGDDLEQKNYSVLYNGNMVLASNEDDSPLTTEEQSEVQQNLMLDPLHNPDATTTLSTNFDKQTREMTEVQAIIFKLNNDIFSQGGTISGTASAAIYPSDYSVSVDLYLNGTLINGVPAAGTGAQPFSFTLNQAGVYTLQATATLPGSAETQAEGSCAVLANTAVADSTWGTKAWADLRANGTTGSVPADPVERNRLITARYADLYNSNHNLEWAGIASFVSATAGDAIHDAAIGAKAAIAGQALAWLSNKSPSIQGQVAAARQMFEQVEQLLVDGNIDIYLSIFPAFLAYEDPNGGINAVDAMAVQGPANQPPAIGQALAKDFDQLNSAITSNPQNQAGIDNAAVGMATYEQSNVLQQAIFQPNLALWAQFLSVGTFFIGTYVPGAKSFFATLPNGNFASDTDRLAYFNQSIFPSWKAWSTSNAGPIDAETIYDGGY